MKSYLEEVAALIRSELPKEAAPPLNSDSLFLLYAVLLRAKGERVTSADVHDAWSAWALQVDPEHSSIVPYGDLDRETQRQDEPYVLAIHRAARRANRD